MGKYQVILLDNPNARLQVTSALNPATLLPIDAAQSPEHDCLHIIELVYSSRRDSKDQPLAEPDMEFSLMEAASWTKVGNVLGMQW